MTIPELPPLADLGDEELAAISTTLCDAYIEITYDADWETHEGSCRVCADWEAEGLEDDVKADAVEHVTEVHVRTAMDAAPILRRAWAEQAEQAIQGLIGGIDQPDDWEEAIEAFSQAIDAIREIGGIA